MSIKRGKTALLAQLERSRDAYQARHESDLESQLEYLEEWQKQRLRLTYADFEARTRYRSATTFFRETLYAPVDLEQRDADLERMVPTMTRLLPESVLMTVAHALELQALSLELDFELGTACVSLGHDLHDLNNQQYSAAYRHCDNYDKRSYQIELLGLVGQELEHWVHVPFVYSTLILCRVPAKLAGLTKLQHFLEEGFSSFRSMRGADDFLVAIQERERGILEAIYAGADNPFDVIEH